MESLFPKNLSESDKEQYKKVLEAINPELDTGKKSLDFIIDDIDNILDKIKPKSFSNRKLYYKVLYELSKSLTFYKNKTTTKRNKTFLKKKELAINRYKNELDLCNVPTSKEYSNVLLHNKYTDPKITHVVLKQLEQMKIAAMDYNKTNSANKVLCIQPLTLKLYDYAMKKFIRSYEKEFNTMTQLISDYEDIIETILSNKIKVSNVQTLLSAIKHYMRFFDNSEEKTNALQNYNTSLSIWIRTQKQKK